MCHFNSPGAYSPAAVSAHRTYRRHCHLCPTRYSFSPESSEAFEGEVSCPRTQHLNNVAILRGEKHDISLKILHQAGFETARQAATSTKRQALAIAPCPSLLWPWTPPYRDPIGWNALKSTQGSIWSNMVLWKKLLQNWKLRRIRIITRIIISRKIHYKNNTLDGICPN